VSTLQHGQSGGGSLVGCVGPRGGPARNQSHGCRPPAHSGRISGVRIRSGSQRLSSRPTKLPLERPVPVPPPDMASSPGTLPRQRVPSLWRSSRTNHPCTYCAAAMPWISFAPNSIGCGTRPTLGRRSRGEPTGTKSIEARRCTGPLGATDQLARASPWGGRLGRAAASGRIVASTAISILTHVVEKIIRPRASLLNALVARISGTSPKLLRTRLAAQSITRGSRNTCIRSP
jgi:hypothetical protein